MRDSGRRAAPVVEQLFKAASREQRKRKDNATKANFARYPRVADGWVFAKEARGGGRAVEKWNEQGVWDERVACEYLIFIT